MAALALPVGYMFVNKALPVYHGYSFWHWSPLVLALGCVWLVPVADGRRYEAVTIITLGVLQLLVVYSMEYLVVQGDFAAIWLRLALPAIAWFAVLGAAARLRRWVLQGGETDEQPRLEHRSLCARATGLSLSTLGFVGLLVAITSLSDTLRTWIWHDYLIFSLVAYGGMIGAFAGAEVFQRRAVPASLIRLPIDEEINDIPATVLDEVRTKIADMNRLQNRFAYGSFYGILVVSIVVYLALGKSSELYVISLFWLGQLALLAGAFVFRRQLKRRWHEMKRLDGAGLEYYRRAAKDTGLAFPFREE